MEGQQQRVEQTSPPETALYQHRLPTRGVSGSHVVKDQSSDAVRDSIASEYDWTAASASPLSVVDGNGGSSTGGLALDTTVGHPPAAASREDLSVKTGLPDQPAPFLLVDDNAINIKVNPPPPECVCFFFFSALKLDFMQMLASYMTKLGRGYDCATNGLEALDYAKATNYRCIFMGSSPSALDPQPYISKSPDHMRKTGCGCEYSWARKQRWYNTNFRRYIDANHGWPRVDEAYSPA